MFLIQREQSVLQKLVAIGGAAEQESFEIQVKARLVSEESVLAALESEDIAIIRSVHYHQYDTYFFFDDADQGRLRYREDEFLDERERGRQRPRAVDADGALARGAPSDRCCCFDRVSSRPPRTRRASIASISSRRVKARSRRIGGDGWWRTAACSSTCTSIAC